MLFDRALGDEDLPGDARVGGALGHQREHLPLPLRQHVERILPPPGPDQLLHQGGVHDRGAGGDPAHRLDEVRHVGHPALQQVAHPLPARQQLHRLVHLDVRGQHDDRGGGQFVADHPGRLQSLGRVSGRHPDVDDSQVRPGRPDQAHQPGGVAGLAHDLISRPVEQAGQALAQQHIVVGEHHPGCGVARRRCLS